MPFHRKIQITKLHQIFWLLLGDQSKSLFLSAFLYGGEHLPIHCGINGLLHTWYFALYLRNSHPPWGPSCTGMDKYAASICSHACSNSRITGNVVSATTVLEIFASCVHNRKIHMVCTGTYNKGYLGTHLYI